jgi:hypothetical protein
LRLFLFCNDNQIAMKLNLELAWLVALVIAVVGQQQQTSSLVTASRVGALSEQLVGLVGALSEELEDEVSLAIKRIECIALLLHMVFYPHSIIFSPLLGAVCWSGREYGRFPTTYHVAICGSDCQQQQTS